MQQRQWAHNISEGHGQRSRNALILETRHNSVTDGVIHFKLGGNYCHGERHISRTFYAMSSNRNNPIYNGQTNENIIDKFSGCVRILTDATCNTSSTRQKINPADRQYIER